ncbi:sodium-extruding oxaloacetate decarboxylase subunit alpha [Aceticella autotrophica]|nr:sodium-extruding oxaloacetate decarboxylase subunit alpha [Aceticella autotrophica]
MGKVKITDTTLRDAHQSLWATRMRTEDMLPIAEKLDSVGYYSLEVWGGATFDVCLRYLNEDPWERLKLLRDKIKKTKLQMLLRGQNLVGYQHYPDDVVERFVAKTAEYGIDIFRIFDALNDIRNIEKPLKAVKKEGKLAQATVVYTISPVHTVEHYVETALKLQDMGADSICVKDMAGLLKPYVAYDLISILKEKLSIPVQLHSHYVGGMAVTTYIKAIEAGVDAIDTASAPLAYGTSQPPIEVITGMLKDTKYDNGLDMEKLFEIAEYFEGIRVKRGFERGMTRLSDVKVYMHQVPGGMISNLVSQLKQQKAEKRLNEVLEEIPKVREDLGYPPLVTPTSQIVGTQAVLNVLLKERYKIIPNEVKQYILGYYGKPPAPIKDEIKKRVLNGNEPITVRPADKLEPIMDKMKKDLKGVTEKEEDIISYAMFPQVALKFFENRKNGIVLNNEDANISERGKNMNLKEISELIKIIDETKINEINLESEGLKISIKKGGTAEVHHCNVEENKLTVISTDSNSARNIKIITSPMVGTFYATPAPDAEPFVKVGDIVKEGQVLCIVEAMKLMNEVHSDVNGKIAKILVKNGEMVEYDQPLFEIEEV